MLISKLLLSLVVNFSCFLLSRRFASAHVLFEIVGNCWVKQFTLDMVKIWIVVFLLNFFLRFWFYRQMIWRRSFILIFKKLVMSHFSLDLFFCKLHRFTLISLFIKRWVLLFSVVKTFRVEILKLLILNRRRLDQCFLFTFLK